MKLLRTITIALFGLMLILTGITEFGIRARRLENAKKNPLQIEGRPADK